MNERIGWMWAAICVGIVYPSLGHAEITDRSAAPPVPQAGVLLSVHGGAGFVAGFGPEAPRGFALHVGTRMMLAASVEQRFGIDFTYIDLDTLNSSNTRSSFIACGLVLEQSLFSGMHMAFGTLGYANVETGQVPFGMLMEVGWKPLLEGQPGPGIVYRAEMIFTGNLSISSSLNLSWAGLF